MPNIMNLNDIVQRIIEKIVTNKFSAGSSHFVHVTHINNPKDFYVRLADISEDVKLLEVQGNRIAVKDINIGKQVIYKSKILKKYVRGIILGVIEDRYNIFAIDYGCSEIHISLKHIYSTQPKLQCPPLAIFCELSLCEPLGKEYSDIAINAMHNFVGKNSAHITIMSISSNQKHSVELKTEECPGGVAQLLAMLNYTALGSCVNTISRLTDSSLTKSVINYKYKKFQVGDRLYTRVQSGENINNFYVSEINEYKKYISSKVDFKNYCMQQKCVEDVHEAVLDQRCCGVQVKRDYERAIVLRVTDSSKAIVKLVDLGNEYETPFHGLKAVASKCHNVRYACAIYCSSSEEQIWNNGLPKFLYPGYEFIIEIVEVGNDKDVPHKVNILPV